MKYTGAWRQLGDWALGMSIRVKIMGIALGMIFLLSLAVMVQVRTRMGRSLTLELQRRGESTARYVAARSTDLILTNDLFELHKLAVDTLRNNSDVRYVLILNANQKALAHTFTVLPPDLLFAVRINPADRSYIEILDTEEGIIHDIAVPIFEGRAGIARVGMTTERIRTVSRELTGSVLKVTLAVSLFAVLAAFGFTQVLVRPLFELKRVALRVGEGLFDQRARVHFKDEIGQLATTLNSMAENLDRMQRELQRKDEIRLQLLDELMVAQEEERKRIARELHDETSQALTSIMVGLKLLEQAQTLEETRRQTVELRLVAARVLEEVHRLALELRPSLLDDLGLAHALQKYGEDFGNKTGLDVDYQILAPGKRRFSPQMEIAIYRIVQEALTNIARHAHARHVSIVLSVQPVIARVIVEDDGCGFDVAQAVRGSGREGKLGLFGMQERAALLGGELTIESSPETGTTLILEIPLAAAPPQNRTLKETHAAHSNFPG